MLLQAPLRDLAAQGLHVAVDAEDELRAGIAVQHDPGFRLSIGIALHALGIRVVRMHLDGEPLPRVDELDEQGKLALHLGAAERRAVFVDPLGQGLPLAAGDAHRVRGDLPALARVVGGNPLAVDAGQARSSPILDVEVGFHKERFQHKSHSSPFRISRRFLLRIMIPSLPALCNRAAFIIS